MALFVEQNRRRTQFVVLLWPFNKFMFENVLFFNRTTSGSPSQLFGTLMILKAACMHNTCYIDRLITSFMRVLQRMAREHLTSSTTEPSPGGSSHSLSVSVSHSMSLHPSIRPFLLPSHPPSLPPSLLPSLLLCFLPSFIPCRLPSLPASLPLPPSLCPSLLPSHPPSFLPSPSLPPPRPLPHLLMLLSAVSVQHVLV